MLDIYGFIILVFFTKVYLPAPDKLIVDSNSPQFRGLKMGDKKQQQKAEHVHCKFKGCKHNPSKYGFCGEHFEMFKFGLINKHGEWVPDYEKKQDQFKAWKARQKVA